MGMMQLGPILNMYMEHNTHILCCALPSHVAIINTHNTILWCVIVAALDQEYIKLVIGDIHLCVHLFLCVYIVIYYNKYLHSGVCLCVRQDDLRVCNSYDFAGHKYEQAWDESLAVVFIIIYLYIVKVTDSRVIYRFCIF